MYDPYVNSWKRMHAKPEPAPRSAGTMAYHKELKKHILFGTQFGDDKHTWAYDLAKNEWTDLKPAEQPPTQYLMVWISSLPETEPDNFQLTVNEVEVLTTS